MLNDMIKAGQWNLPPIGNDVKPDRIGFGDGRVFNVGIKHGVPDYITDAMYTAYGLEAGARSIPEEWLEFEVPAGKLKDERARRKESGRRHQRWRILKSWMEGIRSGISTWDVS